VSPASQWKTWIVPVRVLGKCGGYDSDILAGMSWAGGLPVDGVPAQPSPGADHQHEPGLGGAVRRGYRSVVSQLAARGVLLVVSAGNDGGVVSEPANCPGGGCGGRRSSRGHEGRVQQSRHGGRAECARRELREHGRGRAVSLSIETTSTAGATTPAPIPTTDQLDSNVGTSFPHRSSRVSRRSRGRSMHACLPPR
jgi:serine protease